MLGANEGVSCQGVPSSPLKEGWGQGEKERRHRKERVWRGRWEPSGPVRGAQAGWCQAASPTGNRGPAPESGARMGSDHRQEKALWLAGPGYSQIRSHGQWLHSVSVLWVPMPGQGSRCGHRLSPHHPAGHTNRLVSVGQAQLSQRKADPWRFEAAPLDQP